MRGKDTEVCGGGRGDRKRLWLRGGQRGFELARRLRSRDGNLGGLQFTTAAPFKSVPSAPRPNASDVTLPLEKPIGSRSLEDLGSTKMRRTRRRGREGWLRTAGSGDPGWWNWPALTPKTDKMLRWLFKQVNWAGPRRDRGQMEGWEE